MPRILVFDNYDSFTYNLVHLVEKLIKGKVEVYRNDEIPLEKVKGFDKIILSPGPGIPEEAGLLLPLIREYAASKSILGVCLGHQAIGEAFGGKLVNLSTVYHGVATPVRILRSEPSGSGNVGQHAAGHRAHGNDSGRAFGGGNDPRLSAGDGNRSGLSAETGDAGKLSAGDANRSGLYEGVGGAGKLSAAGGSFWANRANELFAGLPDELEVGRYHSWVVSEEGFPEELEITARDGNNMIMGLRHRHLDIQGVQFHPESVLTPRGEAILQNWVKS